MKSTATLTSKGQITIPSVVRRLLGLRTGDRIEFNMERGKVQLRPAKAAHTSAGVLHEYLPKAWKAKTPAEMDETMARHLAQKYRGE